MQEGDRAAAILSSPHPVEMLLEGPAKTLVAGETADLHSCERRNHSQSILAHSRLPQFPRGQAGILVVALELAGVSADES